ncbi:MAG: MaoC family dehydratase [Desulfobacteraceae bacterium]|nr:MaoC family dehydratase [Desulfobacteraceae bacterium]
MFSAYAKIKEKTYREVFGIDFEQFVKGQIFHHRPGITISQQDNADEAMDTMNSAQLHYDQNYASKTEWKQCLGVSTMTLQKILGSTWKTFARKDRISFFSSIDMTHPVFNGDTLYSESEIIETDSCGDNKCGQLIVETRGINQNSDVVIRLRYTLGLYKAGEHPYYGKTGMAYNLSDEKFSAYVTQKDGSLKEAVGIYYEDLIPGELYEHAAFKVISPSEAREHAQRSLEWDPKYVDPTYYHKYYASSKTNPADVNCPVSQSYLLGGVTSCTTRTFGRVVANLAWTDLKISREIFPNEQFTVNSEILKKRESNSRPDQGIIDVRTCAYDSEKEEVLSFQRVLLVYKSGKGPYAAAGYD